MAILRGQLDRYPLGAGDLIFANRAGGAHRRTLFRTRVWRPSLVRAGLLGSVEPNGEAFAASWTDATGRRHRRRFDSESATVKHVAKYQFGGLRFHDLRHSYATWLVDDGVPPNMVQRVMGHELSWVSARWWCYRPSGRLFRAASTTSTMAALVTRA